MWLANAETDYNALPYILFVENGEITNPPPEDLPKHVPFTVAWTHSSERQSNSFRNAEVPMPVIKKELDVIPRIEF